MVCLVLEPSMRFSEDQNFLGSVCVSSALMRSCHVCVCMCLYTVCSCWRRVMSCLLSASDGPCVWMCWSVAWYCV